jgi:hypothetical protein
MNSIDQEKRKAVLEAQLRKYEERLRRFLTEEPKAPEARYGNEFLQNQIKVYEEAIRTLKVELLRIKQKVKSN